MLAVAVFSVSGAAVAKEGVQLQATTTLPSWRAPGGAFTVEGSAESGAAVSVTSGSLVLGTGHAETSGRFQVIARAPARSGRYKVTVASGGVKTRLGLLLVRPVRIAAGGDFNPGDKIAEVAAVRGPRYPWASVGPRPEGGGHRDGQSRGRGLVARLSGARQGVPLPRSALDARRRGRCRGAGRRHGRE
jgi:hypothetical protein